jgi:hypothetical protein
MKKYLMKLETYDLYWKYFSRFCMIMSLVAVTYSWVSGGLGWVTNIETKSNASATYFAKNDMVARDLYLQNTYLGKEEAKKEYVKLDIYTASEKDRMFRFDIQQKQLDNISEAVSVPIEKRKIVKELLKQLKDKVND